MNTLVRVLVLVSVVISTAPLTAQELSVSAVKAFTARIDDAARRRDVDTVIDHIAELAVISGTTEVQGQMVRFRANKAQYRELLTRTMPAATSYSVERSNEQVSIEGDQAIVTADVVESMVIDGQEFTTKTRERATVESIDGRLMVTQIVSNQVP